ncbi:Kinesin protein [Fasciolopsis buskii]|uniref:Kinesin protein n=1 Tax=Fasciolopsis buskii TaxID=27845 RepID=A0A8E0RZ76_9TREM|nr:Kinesin protein [Fasciolopsis buski]
MTNLCVVARVRPLFRTEQVDDAVECISIRGQQILLTDLQEVKCRLVADNRKRRRIFTFDHIFAPSDDKDDQVLQAEIFSVLGTEALNSIFDGYNSSLFAYGQTGTGKTYTIFGTKDAPGLLPRLCNALLDHVKRNSDVDVTFNQQISILEIYNEKIRDLLVNVPKKNERKSLRVREHPDTGPYVEGQFQFYCRGF